MEEVEVPVEAAQEHIMEKAHHEGSTRRWIEWVALSSALMAGAAAVAALLSGHHANEALIDQLKSSDNYSFFQAKGIKSAVLETRVQLLKISHQDVSKEEEKIQSYKEEQEGIKKKAEDFEKSSELHLSIHQIFARAVTFFQVSIAVSAISVLVRRRRFWFVSLVFSGIGLVFLIQGLVLASSQHLP
jgi:hypothetical protein